jgi:hypothetical protein
MNIHRAYTETLQRLELILKLHLQEFLSNANSVWQLQNDRALTFPSRIVSGEVPNIRLVHSTGKPQVFLRITSSSNPQLDLVGHEDINAVLTVSSLLTGTGRTVADLGTRAQVFSGCVADALITYARKRCDDGPYGLYNISYDGASTPSTAVYEDQAFTRVDQTFNLNIRYLRNSQTTLLPSMPLVDTHLPLNASESITLVETGDPTSTALVAPYSAPQTLIGAHHWVIPAGWKVKVVAGSSVSPELVGGNTVNFTDGTYVVIATSDKGLMPTYTLTIVPSGGP